MDPDLAQHYVGPDLVPFCLQRYKQMTTAFHQGLYYLLEQK